MSQPTRKCVSPANFSSCLQRFSGYCVRLLSLILLVPGIAFADFCAVDNFGNVSTCFPTADMCQSWARNTPGGGCVFQQGGQGGIGQGGSGQAGVDAGFKALREMRDRQRQEANSLRASTPAFLIPLSPEPMSRETVAIITSTLNTALEMEPGEALKEWKNPSTGAQGGVVVFPQKTNQYDSICREFVIVRGARGGGTAIKGSACRVAGEWKILGSTPLEVRDGEIILDNVPQKDSRSSPNSVGRTSGSSCSDSKECGSALYCHNGRCMSSEDIKRKSGSDIETAAIGKTLVTGSSGNDSYLADKVTRFGDKVSIPMYSHNQGPRRGTNTTIHTVELDCSTRKVIDRAKTVTDEQALFSEFCGESKDWRIFYNQAGLKYYYDTTTITRDDDALVVDKIAISKSRQNRTTIHLSCADGTYLEKDGGVSYKGEAKNGPYEPLLSLCGRRQ